MIIPPRTRFTCRRTGGECQLRMWSHCLQITGTAEQQQNKAPYMLCASRTGHLQGQNEFGASLTTSGSCGGRFALCGRVVWSIWLSVNDGRRKDGPKGQNTRNTCVVVGILDLIVMGAPHQSNASDNPMPRPHSTTHPTPSERPDRHISQNLANSSPFHGPKGAWWGLVESKYIENVSRYQKVRRRGRPKPKIGKNEVFSGYLARYSFHPPDMPVQSFR